MFVGEWRKAPPSFFFFVPQEPKLQRQADITRQSQDPTFAMSIEVLIALGSYWQTLRGGWGPCVRVHGLLAEIRAALCTPREWGLAYIECLCCRIESVEHLCLSSLTVKLGLAKNPSYTNRKWSRFCIWHFFTWTCWWNPELSTHTQNVHSTCMLNIYERDKSRGDTANKWRIMWWERWFRGEWRISSVCLLKGRAHIGDRTGVYVD